MSLAQIGEFSFIIAGVGMATGATDRLLYSIAVAVSGITTLLTPWLIRVAPDRRPPGSIASCRVRCKRLARCTPRGWNSCVPTGRWNSGCEFARAIRWLIVDAVVVAAIVIGASVEMDRIAAFAQNWINVPEKWTRLVVIVGAALAAAPFAIGLVQMARALGFELASRAFPAVDREQVDLAAAPRACSSSRLQLAIVLLVGVPLVAITQPFLPPFRGAAVLLFVFVLLAVAFWRGAANFQGHTRAAAQALAEALARQTKKGRAQGSSHWLEGANRVLAGLGSPVPVELPPGSRSSARRWPRSSSAASPGRPCSRFNVATSRFWYLPDRNGCARATSLRSPEVTIQSKRRGSY